MTKPLHTQRGSSVPPGCTYRTRDGAPSDIARKGNLEEPGAAARIGHRIADQARTAGCTRCLSTAELTTGTWHATDPAADGRYVCDSCAEKDDAEGFAQVLAWRRMSRPTLGTAV